MILACVDESIHQSSHLCFFQTFFVTLQPAPVPPELKVEVDPKTQKVTIKNVTVVEFKTSDEMVQAMDEAEMFRETRRTGLNEESSRSHLIFAMMIESRERSTGKTLRGKMSLCDLAGSERWEKTAVEGLSAAERAVMVEEGKCINQSLSVLKNVFKILGELSSAPKDPKKNAPIVPYRENMLTRLMQDSLGGNVRCCI